MFLNAILLTFLSVRLIHVFQLGGYRVKPFLKYIVGTRSRYTFTLFTISFLGFGFVALLQYLLKNVMHGYAWFNWVYLGLIPYFALGVLAVVLNFRSHAKVPLKFTPRVRRLLCVNAVMCLFATFCILAPTTESSAARTLPVLAFFLPFVLIISHYIILPYELLVKKIFERRAQKKLFSYTYSDLVRIGITGSYGKTSCKNMLAAMLEQKYKVCASPESFNTPMGFCKTVLEHLKPTQQIMIMEMGARRRGDIKKMCKLFRPTNGILTSIGKAHLETFKSVDNIRAEKMELLNAIPPDGFKLNNDGWNLSNVELCTQMARHFGVTDEQIKAALAQLKPVPHRLELTTAENGIRILDDGYNSNPDGAAYALKRLAELKRAVKGSRAVVMTPGMVELGKYQFAENQYFGGLIADVADHVIIVGDTNKRAILAGLNAMNYEPENISTVKTIDEAKQLFPKLLKSGDVLLIENDLPDNL
jgi:UDP-N-acetylmuramoyl-tripeptide--D-alanyl-D-alanine ligase